jgi:hypothetical protein
LAVGAIMVAGCSKRAPRVDVPNFDPQKAAAAAMEQYDADKDGKISGAELDKCPGLKLAAEQLDSSGKGEITAQMIADRIQAFKDFKMGRGSINLTVTMNGAPLGGAQVKLVPEKFVAEWLPVCTGKTFTNGAADVSMPLPEGETAGGVPPGFYRVEVTKGNEVPAQYSGPETPLGVEVYGGAKRMGMRVDVKK